MYSIASDGTCVTRLTTATGDDLYPVWSANGTKNFTT